MKKKPVDYCVLRDLHIKFSGWRVYSDKTSAVLLRFGWFDCAVYAPIHPRHRPPVLNRSDSFKKGFTHLACTADPSLVNRITKTKFDGAMLVVAKLMQNQ